ncbi:LLM class F420-dependent oxidoreductase [Actinocorallia sp. A-T 12471]|uniref:LLM class F420-dependent oxidoreductase n=1 Tax=Actinocorallia sp. A-T 12471 TaxID=3089813 RepID=UPI0029CBCFD5|nr:LLM class F420-dependent oxidoreductase [Actinocorallia sp. A-T 12471]MDX6742171.1 LLM class F420-dependent oxidoreductase [Actinocorallia sp. A-T 12471]
MRLALHINDYASFGEPRQMAGALSRVARSAEDAGFSRLSLTDHVWQISLIGEEYEPMLEAYTALGFLAGQTRTIELQTLVTAATYRAPGLLAKIVTTLDVLSEGRAWLGVGAGWNDEEAQGLGLPFAGQTERFARLEQTLQICLQMWSGSREPYVSEHYQLASTLNSPQAVSAPRPRVLVGGGGERTTLRIAAKYADAFNVFGGPDAGQKIVRLREHCERIGRDHTEIEKTAVLPVAVDEPGATDLLLEELRRLHDLGFTTVYCAVPAVASLAPLETLGAKVIPEITRW